MIDICDRCGKDEDDFKLYEYGDGHICPDCLKELENPKEEVINGI